MPLSLAVVSKRQIRTFQIPALVNEYFDATEYVMTTDTLLASFPINAEGVRRVQADINTGSAGASGYIRIYCYDGTTERLLESLLSTAGVYETVTSSNFLFNVGGELRVYGVPYTAARIWVKNIRIDRVGSIALAKVGTAKNTGILYPNVNVDLFDNNPANKYAAKFASLSANSRGIADFNYKLVIASLTSGLVRVIHVPEGFAG